MGLEQTLQMYEVGRSETFEMSVYNISNRLYELYTGGSGGTKLTIRDFPASGFQLHIHEGEDGTAKLKDYKGNKISEMNSYDAAMADLLAGRLNLKKIIR